MNLLTLCLLIILTCIVFWLWGKAYAHAGKIPDAPPIMAWALQGITIIVLIVVICAIWGIGGGYISTGSTLTIR